MDQNAAVGEGIGVIRYRGPVITMGAGLSTFQGHDQEPRCMALLPNCLSIKLSVDSSCEGVVTTNVQGGASLPALLGVSNIAKEDVSLVFLGVVAVGRVTTTEDIDSGA